MSEIMNKEQELRIKALELACAAHNKEDGYGYALKAACDFYYFLEEDIESSVKRYFGKRV